MGEHHRNTFFDIIINFLNNFENGFVNLIAKLVPLLVPLIPAYVSYQHVIRELEFSPFFAFTYALVVEGLGYASVYKALQFWEWNRHYKKEENQSPFWLALGIYITYLTVILWVNVMLDWQTGVVWYRVIAVAAISLLSVPAGLLVSISAIHTERVREREETKEQLKQAREVAKKNRENQNNKVEEKLDISKPDEPRKSKTEIICNWIGEYIYKNNKWPSQGLIQDSLGKDFSGTAIYYGMITFVFENKDYLLDNSIISKEKFQDYIASYKKWKKIE